MNIDTRQLRAFLTVAECGSFTRAAGRLHLSQPALTVQIRRLEEQLDLRLFDRNTRSVALTRAGAELVPTLARILADLDGALSDARDLSALRRGVVRLAVLPSFASGILPEIIAAFRQKRPQIDFMLRDVIASGVEKLLIEGEVDIGLMGGPVGHPDIEVLFRSRDHMHVVFPAGHALEELETIGLAEIARFPLILMDAATSVRRVVDAAFAEAGIMPDRSAEVIYMTTAVGMVRAGLGVAILPGSAMEVRAVESLRSRRIEAQALSRQIAIVRRRGRSVPAASALFLEALQAALPPA